MHLHNILARDTYIYIADNHFVVTHFLKEIVMPLWHCMCRHVILTLRVTERHSDGTCEGTSIRRYVCKNVMLTLRPYRYNTCSITMWLVQVKAWQIARWYLLAPTFQKQVPNKRNDCKTYRTKANWPKTIMSPCSCNKLIQDITAEFCTYMTYKEQVIRMYS